MIEDDSLKTLSEKEAAPFVGVSHSTMRRWRGDNIGPAYFRCGRIIRYTLAALKSFQKKHTVQPSSARDGKSSKTPKQPSSSDRPKLTHRTNKLRDPATLPAALFDAVQPVQ